MCGGVAKRVTGSSQGQLVTRRLYSALLGLWNGIIVEVERAGEVVRRLGKVHREWLAGTHERVVMMRREKGRVTR